MIKKLAFMVFGIVFLFTVYSFLYGKLFVYSPIIVGFQKNELSNTVIYVQKESQFNDFERINSLIPAIEKFHDLKFGRKPEIFIFKNKESYLQRSISNARFCVFYNGRLVISPWALDEDKEGAISLDIYLTHELSHSLIYQHTGIIGAMRFPSWLLEGVAVYSSNQMGTSWYPSKKEVYDYIKAGNFLPPTYFKTSNEDKIKLNVKYRITFMYSEFACIVDYLVKSRGESMFLAYLKELIKNSKNEQVFKNIYKIDFEEFINEFKTIVRIKGRHLNVDAQK